MLDSEIAIQVTNQVEARVQEVMASQAVQQSLQDRLIRERKLLEEQVGFEFVHVVSTKSAQPFTHFNVLVSQPTMSDVNPLPQGCVAKSWFGCIIRAGRSSHVMNGHIPTGSGELSHDCWIVPCSTVVIDAVGRLSRN